jgi:tetratricopeptide (TPR) repeat protein
MDPSWRFKIAVLALLPLALAITLGIRADNSSLNQAVDRAEKYNQEGMVEVAANEWVQAAKINPWRGDLWEQAGLAAWRDQDYFDAEVHLFEAEDTIRLSDKGTVALIDSLYRTGNQQLAFTRLDGIGTNQTNLESIYQPLVEDTLRHGEAASAVVLAKRWQVVAPDNSRANYLLALAMAMDDPYGALTFFKKAALTDTTLDSSLKKFQDMLSLRGKEWDESLKDLYLSKFYTTCGEWKLAEKAAINALEDNMEQAEAWAYLGEIRQHLGLDGLAELDKAGQLDPNSVTVKGLTALYWQRHQKPEQALIYLHAAADLEPENAVWQLGLANTLIDLNEIAQAQSYYEKAAELEPQNTEYWTALAGYAVHYHSGLPDLGLKAARQVILYAPDQASSYDLMGQVFYEVEDMDSASRFFNRSLQMDPGYAPAHLHLGWLYFRQNQLSYAQSEWTAAAKSMDEITRQQAEKLIQQYFPGK